MLIAVFICSCGVKNDVIPPEEPWIIFEQQKKKKTIKKKKLKNGSVKNVDK